MSLSKWWSTACTMWCTTLITASVASAQPGPGPGFGPPTPPVVEAIDKDKNGSISPAELADSPTALRKLDKNNDGQIAGAELLPDFGSGGRRGGGGRGGRRGFNPFGESRTERLSPAELKSNDGAAEIPDDAAFHKLSYKGPEVMIDTFLADLEFVKFTLDDASSDKRQMYFINTKTHRAHMMFARVAGLPRGRGSEQMKGVLVYRPHLEAPNGSSGLFTFEFEPFDAYSLEMVRTCQTVLIEKAPLLKGRLGYFPRGDRAIELYWKEKADYDKSEVSVYLASDLVNADATFLPLNLGQSFGRLRVMKLDERPSPRDIVLYRSLPNEMPRVAGIITEVRQTPLSHVNLRAVQDRVPNAFIGEASQDESIKSLIGQDVAYEVTRDGFTIREATQDELEEHFAKLRPAEKQIPPRDLSVKKIRPLDQIAFEDSTNVGVKAANLAAMRKFGLREGTVPDGFAVPFYFYDEFMKHNGFYDQAREMLADETFQRDRETQEARLKKLRSRIKQGEMPDWMLDELETLHRQFPVGRSIRCRSSTNNEDLPGFSGAGLYDSYTHKRDEGHLSKSIKQVYASLWNFRAFDEREFYRVDHLQAAMGVLVHPNYKGELANGVAVTDDILYGTDGNYYLNTQVGEDLVTNPEALSIPEEILLDWYETDKMQVMRTSSRSPDGKLLLSPEHLEQMRKSLGRIHSRFAKLYGKDTNDIRFAMEIEFKVDKHGKLAIKQARPWVYMESAVPQRRSNSGGFGFGRGGFSFGGPPRGPGGGGPGGRRGMPPFALMTALDANGDGKLSGTEVEKSIDRLSKLDEDDDGSLSAREIGWPPEFGGR